MLDDVRVNPRAPFSGGTGNDLSRPGRNWPIQLELPLCVSASALCPLISVAFPLSQGGMHSQYIRNSRQERALSVLELEFSKTEL